jgi:homoprotocatechuate degradation regulator HpaR
MSKPSLRMKHRNLPLLLLQAREQVIARFRPILNERGITEQQWRIVRLLLESGPLEPREIGEQCKLSSPSLAGVLARMEELRFIKRKRVKHDQRRVMVSLAPGALALAERIGPQVEAIYTEVESILGKAFCQRFYESLDEVIEKLRPPTSVR